MGYVSMCDNDSGDCNTAIGASTLKKNTSGSHNVAIGNTALDANTTGTQNVAIGLSALGANTTASENVAVGCGALGSNTEGGANTAVGRTALTTATTGCLLTALGTSAGREITTGDNNLVLGFNAGRSSSPFGITTEDNRIVLGNNSITNFYAKVALTVTSDLRDKTEIADVPHGLEFVNQMKPVSFKFKKSREDNTPTGTKHYGFLAQDILELEGSDNVIIDDEQPDHLKYKGEHLVPVLVNAIKELTARVKELENE
jgi:hypothetical protein